jgi:serine/threonine protein kinase
MDRAVKVYRKQELSLSRLHSLQKEVNIYLMLSHPNIVKLHNVYESNETVHLSMELCSGGELYTRLKQKGNFSEKSAARAAFQMLSAIEHLHMQGIVHRDLKLENWLYESDVEDAPLKLADFGFSTKWNGREPMHESCGTTSYLAPEVFQANYTEKCDMWSFGVIMFALLNGKMPFVGKDRELVDMIFECEYSFQNHISEEAQDFVEGLLKLNPENRMSASECLVHPWITQHVTDNTTWSPQQLSALPSLLVRSRSAMENVAIIPQKVTRGGA